MGGRVFLSRLLPTRPRNPLALTCIRPLTQSGLHHHWEGITNSQMPRHRRGHMRSCPVSCPGGWQKSRCHLSVSLELTHPPAFPAPCPLVRSDSQGQLTQLDIGLSTGSREIGVPSIHLPISLGLQTGQLQEQAWASLGWGADEPVDLFPPVQGPGGAVSLSGLPILLPSPLCRQGRSRLPHCNERMRKLFQGLS